jgi:hypothetical protein
MTTIEADGFPIFGTRFKPHGIDAFLHSGDFRAF